MSEVVTPDGLKWLRGLWASLDRSEEGQARKKEEEKAAVAIIIRSQPPLPLSVIHSSSPTSPHQTHDDPAPALQVLFMKRAPREGDPWSGHVSFPGGRVEHSDSSLLHTAIRETQEEVALDLRPDTGRYAFWGRGPNAQVRTRTPFQVGTFVFYELAPEDREDGTIQGEEESPWVLAPTEVSSVRWQSLWSVVPGLSPQVERKEVTWPFRASFMSQRGLVRWVWGWWQPAHIYFPGVLLAPTHEAGDRPEDEYHLWGMTYHVLLQLLRDAAHHAPHDLSPIPLEAPFRFRHSCLDWLLHSFHSLRGRL